MAQVKPAEMAVVDREKNSSKSHAYDKHIDGTTLDLSGKNQKFEHKYADQHLPAIMSFVRNRPVVEKVDLSYNRIKKIENIRFFKSKLPHIDLDYTGNPVTSNESVLINGISVKSHSSLFHEHQTQSTNELEPPRKRVKLSV